MLDYKGQLLDKRWIKLRNKVRARYQNRCTACYTTKVLEVHHLKYTGKAWEAPITDLVLLCPTCHRKAHGGDERFIKKLKEIANFDLSKALR